MSIHNLDKIFKPHATAVIGASERKGTIGYALVKNLIDGGYGGGIFPVNPRAVHICGLKAYGSVRAIGQRVDLAIIATPISKTPEIIRECVEAEVGGGIIISAGGKEVGEKGQGLELKIKEEADKGGFRIIGPNCMGILCSEERLNASFAMTLPLPGKLALISQSGAICAAILDRSKHEGIGFRYFVSIGSILDVDFGDLLNYLGSDPKVSSIVLYVENLTNARKFMTAARAVSRVKPIVVLKGGRFKSGALAAASHTGALAGEDAVYGSAFKRTGIVRVDTIEELFDCAELMAKHPIPKGPRLGIITNGGGPGVMAADALNALGLDPAPLSSESLRKLDEFLPPFWSRGNPVDILGDASPDRWKRAMRVCLSAPEIDALVIIFVPQTASRATSVAKAVVELMGERQRVPVFAVWMGGEGVEEGRRILNKANIPTYDMPERAVRAYAYMHAYAQNLEMLQEIPEKFSKALKFNGASAKEIIGAGLELDKPVLTEWESKRLLDAYGIPVNRTEVAQSAEEAACISRDVGYPVVMKIHSRQIAHKSDANGVKLNLRSDQDVMCAFDEIMDSARSFDPKAALMGVTVQPMLHRSEIELILGSKRDSDFGPVILFGIGGIMTEVLKDQSIALPPLNRLLARRLMEQTRIYRILKGYRNIPPVNLDRLEEILMRLSQLVTDFPEIIELDINPLIFQGHEAFAVDARAFLESSDIISPNHLVISPYPNQYETTVRTKGGLDIFVRPIRPEDAPLLEALFKVLSPRTVYYRFFSPMKSLPRKMLARFTQIDYDRDMALVAIDMKAPFEKMLGVARLMGDPSGKRGEFAVLVGDPWQGKGIGAALLARLLGIARDRRMESLWGVVLAENTHMLALGRKLGFGVSRIPGEREFELNIDLRHDPLLGRTAAPSQTADGEMLESYEQERLI